MKYISKQIMSIKSKSPIIAVLILFLLLANLVSAQTQADTTQHINFHNKNSLEQQQKPYVILISADGFRHDYATKHGAHHLLELSKTGVQAESMIPSFPSVTFPNHYSIATGLYPAHHGLVNNTFYDKKKRSKYSMGAKTKLETGVGTAERLYGLFHYLSVN
jgi:predicted AlkP superfamily pyrophosphatase or phosphodiesterase